jgi:nitrogen fixation NifU-like protein
MEHFRHPKNMGEIKNPSITGRVGNPLCGDILELQLKIVKKKVKGKEVEFIKDAKFKSFGCGAAIATSSMLTQLIKGKTIEDAKKISNQTITESLGGLPPIKIHCSVLAQEAFDKSIENWQKSKESKSKTNN